MDRAAEFYSLLGLKFTRHRHGSGPEHLSADLMGTTFELYPQGAEAASTLGTRVGFDVTSMDAVLTALGRYPEAILSSPQDSPWGRRAVVTDPDGHRVELIEKI